LELATVLRYVLFAISNSGFEDWSNVQYFEDPDGYNTTNILNYFEGYPPNVTKSTDAYSGSYALRLETINTSYGATAGAAFIGQPEEDTFVGGMPYDERPDSLTGYVKYNVNSNDTAYVAAIFKKFGFPIGIGFGQFTGVENDFQYFSVPVDWYAPIISPDTLAIVLMSSSIFTTPVAGNVLTVDLVQLVGPGDPFPNGDFENWTEFTAEETDNWQSSNIFTLPVSSISVNKTTDSHSGSFAVKIESMITSFSDTLGFITNGHIGEDGPVGGMPVEDIPNILSGYYKYTPVGPDTAIGGMTLYHYNENTGESEMLDSAFINLPATNNYTYFEIPVDYFSLPEPDTLNIVFGSGNFDEQGVYIGLGSTLYLDDLEITYKPHIVSVDDNHPVAKPRIYPNPARENIIFETLNLLHQPVEIQIYNMDGQIVAKKGNRNSANFSFNVGHLSPGIYFYRMSAGQQSHQGKFIVE